jgi:fatty acid-binding protein DegV
VADVAVVTDSTAYLPDALVESLGITVVSLYFDVNGAASPNGGHELPGRGLRESEFDGDLGRFFAELDASKSVATTSPPTVEDFVGVFDRLLQQHSAVVAVMLGSEPEFVSEVGPVVATHTGPRALSAGSLLAAALG